MNWKEVAKEKDDGTFAIYGMKRYLSECSNIYPYVNAECINYIIETFLECIDDIDFLTWLKKGNGNGRPIIITREMLQKDFKDLLEVSEDLESICDLFMYLYDIEMWLDEEIDCLYTTMFNINYTNRTKLNFIGIAMEYERLATVREHQVVNWDDIDSFVECVAEYGYDMDNDYKYRAKDVDETADNILERIGQIFPSLQYK